MPNNTAESQINVVYPYSIEAHIVDITEQRETLAQIPAGESFASTLLEKSESSHGSTVLIE